ncbi:TetR/AcrR family transcriptional regulator [Herbaspirillum sp. C7C8]|jgi:AcrR family transcriptional regulator|uniref:TetR/AcrR family transcriptional regulator n=1 Tax=Herbaspirillum sp. C7C8 TaxID=2736665 RepID=UPI001F5247B7|nr:TetR/AcrR family transcriptional regulator [Herbaspirillum sp. C7C8]MCI1006080.1 TetR/AcrR family transcriptional regulator [Herbaspirillum sp. C7C8]
MDNSTRSEKSRQLIIQAALSVIARDGANKLTIDAIAKEAGISKGGVLHHFRTKQAVLVALLDNQRVHFGHFAREFLDGEGKHSSEPALAMQISVLREASKQPHSVALAILGAISEQPSLVEGVKMTDAEHVAAIRKEAADPDLAILRWTAARGLLWTSLFNMCPLSEQERQRCFDLLLDESRWTKNSPQQSKPRKH